MVRIGALEIVKRGLLKGGDAIGCPFGWGRQEQTGRHPGLIVVEVCPSIHTERVRTAVEIIDEIVAIEIPERRRSDKSDRLMSLIEFPETADDTEIRKRLDDVFKP